MKLFFAFAFAFVVGSASAEFNSSSGPVPQLRNEGRVLNGFYAIPGQFPYQVGMKVFLNRGLTFCGGSLIGEKWILTAAHCIIGAEKTEIYLGTLAFAKSRKVITTKKHKISVHSNYSITKKEYDIGLIKIPAVKLSASIQIVRLPAIASTYSRYENEVAIVSGWGRRQWDSEENLTWGIMRVISNAVCLKIYGDAITERRMCTNSEDGSFLYTGDSGGPLVLQSSRTLIGVVSQMSATNYTRPIAYTRVTSYLEWIKSITGIFY